MLSSNTPTRKIEVNSLHTCDTVQQAIDLIANGADINGRDRNNRTPIHANMRQGKINIVLYLISLTTANINLQETDGTAPLHLAESPEVNRTLLERCDINPNIQDNQGITPLMKAILYPKVPVIVECLLGHKDICLDITDVSGKKAIEHAYEKMCSNNENSVKIYKLIKDKMDLVDKTKHEYYQPPYCFMIPQFHIKRKDASTSTSINRCPLQNKNNQ